MIKKYMRRFSKYKKQREFKAWISRELERKGGERYLAWLENDIGAPRGYFKRIAEPGK